jgi:hypothetical protein
MYAPGASDGFWSELDRFARLTRLAAMFYDRPALWKNIARSCRIIHPTGCSVFPRLFCVTPVALCHVTEGRPIGWHER